MNTEQKLMKSFHEWGRNVETMEAELSNSQKPQFGLEDLIRQKLENQVNELAARPPFNDMDKREYISVSDVLEMVRNFRI